APERRRGAACRGPRPVLGLAHPAWTIAPHPVCNASRSLSFPPVPGRSQLARISHLSDNTPDDGGTATKRVRKTAARAPRKAQSAPDIPDTTDTPKPSEPAAAPATPRPPEAASAPAAAPA